MIPDDRTCRIISRLHDLHHLSLMRIGRLYDLRVRDVRLALEAYDNGWLRRRMCDRPRPSLPHVSLVDGAPFP